MGFNSSKNYDVTLQQGSSFNFELTPHMSVDFSSFGSEFSNSKCLHLFKRHSVVPFFFFFFFFFFLFRKLPVCSPCCSPCCSHLLSLGRTKSRFSRSNSPAIRGIRKVRGSERLPNAHFHVTIDNNRGQIEQNTVCERKDTRLHTSPHL